MKPVSSRKTHPKCKVQSLLKHAIMVSKDAIVMGEGFVVVEEKIGCKGIQTDILRITYKNIVFRWLHVQLFLPQPAVSKVFH